MTECKAANILVRVWVYGILGLVLSRREFVWVIGRCELVWVVWRCELYEKKQHNRSLRSNFLWQSFPSDGISRLCHFHEFNVSLLPGTSLENHLLEMWCAYNNSYCALGHQPLITGVSEQIHFFDFSGNTERASSLMASKLIFRAECRTKEDTVSTLIQQSAIIFSFFITTAWRCLLDSDRLCLWTHLISTIGSQWPYSLPN